ncbi:hypothetical protein N7528_000865 [Penicillium herquei]|nr:hypothetical protein N7528_000865 [Penicillium herquei]
MKFSYDQDMAGPSSIPVRLGVPSSTNPDDDLEYDPEVAGPSPDQTHLAIPESFLKHIWRVSYKSKKKIAQKLSSPVEEPGPYDIYVPAPATKELDWKIAGQPYSLMAGHKIQSSEIRDEGCSLEIQKEARPSCFGPLLPTPAIFS